MSGPAFEYAEFVQRNLGFVTETEQARLRAARVMICGVGGMGGACLQSLVRAGVGAFVLADIDVFELSNLNRQVFANLDTVGANKVDTTVRQLKAINPDVELDTYGAEWLGELDRLLPRCQVVINGMDDVAAGIHLYRKAREYGVSVIDAYTSPLPSVVVVQPHDPRPEQRLGFPSQGRDPAGLSPEECKACTAREIRYVLIHSSSARHVELTAAAELMAGRRKRMSLAPMVITTGNLMAFEAMKLLLDRRPLADCRGYFFNPWSMRVERPRPAPVAWALGWATDRFIARLVNG